MKLRNFQMILCLYLIFAIFAVGCNRSNSTNKPSEIYQEKEYTLKLAHHHMNSFNKIYGNLIQNEFPNLKLEVVDNGFLHADDLGKWIEERQPDIVFIPIYQKYLELIRGGYLTTLDSLIKRDKYILDDIAPGVIQLMKSNDQGEIYGLAPNFSSYALFFNQTIFDRLKIPYPTDRMDWFSVFELAQQIQTSPENHSDYIGFLNKFSTPANLIMEIGKTEGLSYFDPETKTITFHTESWKRIMREVADGYQLGIIKDPEHYPNKLPENTAIFIGSYLDYRQLIMNPSIKINGKSQHTLLIPNSPIYLPG